MSNLPTDWRERQIVLLRALAVAASRAANRPCDDTLYGVAQLVERIFDDGDIPTWLETYQYDHGDALARYYGYSADEIDQGDVDWGDIHDRQFNELMFSVRSVAA